MEHKKYRSIRVLDESVFNAFRKGDRVLIQEKVDGANFSLHWDAGRDAVIGSSRYQELDPNDDMRGALDWVQQLDKEAVREILGGNLVLFGEWLVEHEVTYPEHQYK